MIINPDMKGRTVGGRYTWRPLVEVELDDFDYPPDSKFWMMDAQYYQGVLADELGLAYKTLAELIWPGATIEEYTWRDISQQMQGALKAYRNGERDLNKLCVAAWDAVVKAADPESFPYPYCKGSTKAE